MAKQDDDKAALKATLNLPKTDFPMKADLPRREPERLAFTVSDQPGADVYDLCTVDLSDLGGKRTEMLFTQSGGHMPAAAYRRAEQGWSGFFTRIAERLAADESGAGEPS